MQPRNATTEIRMTVPRLLRPRLRDLHERGHSLPDGTTLPSYQRPFGPRARTMPVATRTAGTIHAPRARMDLTKALALQARAASAL